MLRRPGIILTLGLVGACSTPAGRSEFVVPAAQVSSAWIAIEVQERREAEAEQPGMYDEEPGYTLYTDARCRWTEPRRRALCRYRSSRQSGRPRAGKLRHWVKQRAEFYLTDHGWSVDGS
jgi:hypothetical protein